MFQRKGNIAVLILLSAVIIVGVAGYIWYKTPGRYCGGLFGIGCSKGSTCQPLDPKNPGGGGTCLPNEVSSIPVTTVSKPIPTPPESTSSANLETYTNLKYAYEIKYPSNWKITEASDKPADPTEYGASLEAGELQKVTILGVNIGACQFRVLGNPGKFTLDDWQKIYNPTAASGAKLVRMPVQDYLFGGAPAKQLSVFGFDHDDTVVISNKNGLFYLASYSNTEGNSNYSTMEQTSEQTCKNIVSGFKFL